MMLEETSGSLRVLGERLFDLVRELTGREPQLVSNGKWYGVRSDHGVFLYFRFTSARARAYPRNSIVLAARWDDSFKKYAAIPKNDWFGSNPSANLPVRPQESGDVTVAEQFVRHAFELRKRQRGG